MRSQPKEKPDTGLSSVFPAPHFRLRQRGRIRVMHIRPIHFNSTSFVRLIIWTPAILPTALGVCAFSLLLCIVHASVSRASTSDFYKCAGRVSGEWNFGRAPYACNADSFGDDRVVHATYPSAIFGDTKTRDNERARYVEEIHAIVRDAAIVYMTRRKPDVSDEELEAWIKAVITITHQESYMSHYRLASDGRLKMMRGDSGHGHGLMQIDDRAHFPVIDNGTAWNLITNLTYGFDIYFREWQRAPSQSCVRGATDFVARTRSAWSAYNGGPNSICRWTNSKSKWAANDRGFYEKLQQQSWKIWVADERKPAPVDVACLMDKKENCPPPVPGTDPDTPSTQDPSERTLYRIDSEEGSKYCVYSENRFACVNDPGDSICLRKISSFSNTALNLSADSFSRHPHADFDRHSLCRSYDPTLLPVGTYLAPLVNINLRATPGGGKVGLAEKGKTFAILDFDIRSYPANDRYYQIAVGNQVGFIYAGTSSDTQEWVRSVSAPTDANDSVLEPGERLEIVNPPGINLRSQPGGPLLLTLAQGTKLTVLSAVLRGSQNEVYYQVTSAGKTGFIYAGRLKPEDTTARWARRLPR